MGGKNSGKAVGGSTVHFAMVSLRFRPEWFKSRSQLGLWRGLAARLAGDVGMVRRARRRRCRSPGPSPIPGGPKRPRYPYAGASDQRSGAAAGPRRRGDGICLDGNAARHRLRAEGGQPALRLSRLLPLRLLDQRQAEPARHLHSARVGGGRRDPRSRDGRADRNGRRRAGHGRALPSRRPLALSEGARPSSSPATRSRRRGCC